MRNSSGISEELKYVMLGYESGGYEAGSLGKNLLAFFDTFIESIKAEDGNFFLLQIFGKQFDDKKFKALPYFDKLPPKVQNGVGVYFFQLHGIFRALHGDLNRGKLAVVERVTTDRNALAEMFGPGKKNATDLPPAQV